MTSLLEKMKKSIINDFQGWTEVTNKENPISLLNKYVRESEQELEKAAQLIERQKLLKDKFYKEWKSQEAIAKKRKEQEQLAVQAGEELLAETALKYRIQVEEQVEKIKRFYELTIDQLSELEDKYEEMKLKVKDMHIKRMELMGRENVLSMKERMNKILNDSEFGHAAQNFEDIESTMKQKETNVDEEYEITVFDAKIQQLAKQLNRTDKQKQQDQNMVQ